VSDNRVSLLTPPGTGAIATVEVAGPDVWKRVRELFSKPLPEAPEPGRAWHGRLAGDDVVLAVKQPDTVEIHCHGGRRIVREVMRACGFAERERAKPQAADATTLRTASILLDQHHGAFDRAVKSLLDSFDPVKLAELARFAPLGRHLVAPWRIAVAGAPNVGKSSLINALAGYQRSVVSEVPGTTRDVVTVRLAFDGWPVELADTAGLREAAGLEAEGIARAERCLKEADLVLWVLDASEGSPEPGSRGGLAVLNKCDLSPASSPEAIRVSAKTGEGIPSLIAAIVRRLVPCVPEPGAAVPYTPHLADRIERAHAAQSRAEAIALLREAIG
jgi:tRNA modification GTPase